MKFQSLKIDRWQQFGHVNLSFGKRLTVLTGANGSGKTTILNLLAKHWGWQSVQMAVPTKDKLTSLFGWLVPRRKSQQDEAPQIGSLSYSNGTIATLHVPSDSAQAQYNVDIRGQQSVESFFIPSHRSVFRYERLENIPTQGVIGKEQAFQRVSHGNRGRYFGEHHKPASFHIKEVLVYWSIFGHGNPDMEANGEMLQYFRDFESVLRIVLPKELGFSRLAIRNQEVVMVTTSGDFIVDAASGGVSALIDIAWQVFMFAEAGRDLTVIIDEVESHLHPSMQRRILPDLLEAFPSVSFIVSTHSPLIVSSVRDADIFVLKFKNGNVASEQLDLVGAPLTATQVLDDVLGVSSTLPIWAESELKTIVDKLSVTQGEPAHQLRELRAKLRDAGLESLMPEAISEVVRRTDD